MIYSGAYKILDANKYLLQEIINGALFQTIHHEKQEILILVCSCSEIIKPNIQYLLVFEI